MKWHLLALAAGASRVMAQGLPGLDFLKDVRNDMLDAIEGFQECRSVAVIFARGIFDSGNIGVWVGPQFFNAIKTNVKSLALQGVEPGAYKADIQGYLDDGGSTTGATGLAQMVDAYVNKCPKTSIIVSGWSQGALVAHKGLAQISRKSIKQVKGFVTFGDPNNVWNDLPLPAELPVSKFRSYCETDIETDMLCADDTSIFDLPSSTDDIIEAMVSLPSIAEGAQQVAAAATIYGLFPGQLIMAWKGVLENLTPDKWVRYAFTPAHWRYGNNGMADDAGKWVSMLEGVRGK